MKIHNLTLLLENSIKKFATVFGEDDIEKFTAYFYIILTLVTVSFFGIFAIGPTLNTVSNLNKQYEDNKVVYDALSQKLTNIALLDSQYQSIKSQEEAIYSAIPRSNDIPKLTRQLENIAAANNVQVIKLTFATIEIFPNVKKPSIYSYTFSINVEGNKEDVDGFVADTINFDRIVGVEKIVTGLSPENKYTTAFTGRVFFAP